MCDSQVGHQQVRGQVARSERTVRRLEEGQTRNAAGVGLPSAQRQTVRVQTPARVQGETQNCADRKEMKQEKKEKKKRDVN